MSPMWLSANGLGRLTITRMSRLDTVQRDQDEIDLVRMSTGTPSVQKDQVSVRTEERL